MCDELSWKDMGLRAHYHHIPLNDVRDHEPSPDCWCKPIVSEEDDDMYLHNPADGRFLYEDGTVPVH